MHLTDPILDSVPLKEKCSRDYGNPDLEST